MRLSNYITMIDWDLREALVAQEKINDLFQTRLRARDRAEKILGLKQEELREVSILRAEISQTIGELQNERFANDEEWDDWKRRH